MKTKNKTQIVSVLALALALGLAVPAGAFVNDAFAVDETQAGKTQAEERQVWTRETQARETQTVDSLASLAALYRRTQDSAELEDFREREGILSGLKIFETVLLQPADEMLQNSNLDEPAQGSKLWYNDLSEATKTAIAGQPLVVAISVLKQDSLYERNKEFAVAVDGLENLMNTAVGLMIPQLMEDFPDNEAWKTGKVDLSELLQMANSTVEAHYEAYMTMLDLEAEFTTKSTADGRMELDTALMERDFTPSELSEMYAAYAAAVEDVAPDLLEGLPIYSNDVDVPNVGGTGESGNNNMQKPAGNGAGVVGNLSAGGDVSDVKVPATGIVGLLEDGSIDVGMACIMVTTVVAVLVGGGLVARLYLGRKIK